MRSSTILALSMLVISAFGLFQIKHTVRNLTRDLTLIHIEILDEKEAIHVLTAEWSYLTKPERLKALAEEHLSLQAINVSQLHKIRLPEPVLRHKAVASAVVLPEGVRQ